MTTKAAALYEWMNSHGIPAYPATSVPEDAEMPYLTYEPYFGAFGDGETNLVVSAWFRTESEAAPNKLVDNISKKLMGSAVIGCDNGFIWLKRGEPFAYAVPDTDNTIKRRNINISIEFMTLY